MFDLEGLTNIHAAVESLAFPMIVIFCAYLVRGIAGFGSALIAVPLLALSIPLTIVVPMVVFLDYLGSASHGINDKQYIVWSEIWPLLPFSLLGVVLSLYVMESVNPQILSMSLGAFIIAFAIYQLLPLSFGKASNRCAPPAGLLGGFVGTLFGTGGPFYVIYLNLRKLGKTEFRATFAMIFLIDGIMRLAGYALKGFYNMETLVYILAALPVCGAGMFIGGKIHSALSREVFVRMISLLLLGSGTALLYKA